MNASRRWMLFTALSITPAVGLAQVQQGAAGMLTLTTSNASAAADLRASIESFFICYCKGGLERASNALAMDTSFALARSWRAFYCEIAARPVPPIRIAKLDRAGCPLNSNG